jgi:hypothetical protein
MKSPSSAIIALALLFTASLADFYVFRGHPMRRDTISAHSEPGPGDHSDEFAVRELQDGPLANTVSIQVIAWWFFKELHMQHLCEPDVFDPPAWHDSFDVSEGHGVVCEGKGCKDYTRTDEIDRLEMKGRFEEGADASHYSKISLFRAETTRLTGCHRTISLLQGPGQQAGGRRGQRSRGL